MPHLADPAAVVDPMVATPPILRFQRRRYGGENGRGGTMFTWVAVQHRGVWLDLGDPWQCVTPAKAQVAEAIARVTAAYDAILPSRTAPAFA